MSTPLMNLGAVDAYMRDYFFGGNLQPQLKEMEKSLDDELNAREKEFTQEVLRELGRTIKDANDAIKKINAIPFGKGAAQQIEQLKKTVEDSSKVQTELQAQLRESQVYAQSSAENLEMLQRKLAGLRQILHSRQSESSSFDTSARKFENSVTSYLARRPI